MLKRVLLALALFGLTLPAHAQVIQSGNVTNGHAVVWTTNGVVQDAGTAAAPNGLTSLGITNNGGPAECLYSAALTVPYNALCFSVSTAAAATISLQNYGGASGQALNFLINGTSYPFPGSLSQISIGTTPVVGGSTGSCLFVNGSVVGQQVCALSSITALFGDITATGPGSVTSTLATVNSAVGTFGSSSAVPVITVNGKGLITNVTTAGVASVAAGTLTGTTLASNVILSSLTQVGTITVGTWNGTIVSPTYGGTGINNGANTLTLAGNLITTGAFASTFAFTGANTYNFPNQSNDTVAMLVASQTLQNKTFSGGTFSGTIAGTPNFSGAGFISLANIANQTGYSLLGNTGAGSASPVAFTIGGLTQKSSPGGSDLVLIQDQAASGQMKFATVSSIAAGATVASVNGQTGSVNILGCIAGSGANVGCPGILFGDIFLLAGAL